MRTDTGIYHIPSHGRHQVYDDRSISTFFCDMQMRSRNIRTETGDKRMHMQNGLVMRKMRNRDAFRRSEHGGNLVAAAQSRVKSMIAFQHDLPPYFSVRI